MKRFIYCIFALALAVSACDRQDDTYRQYVVNGGYNYPAKPAAIATQSGYLKVRLSWATPLDPAVKAVKVYWDNYADSMEVAYSSAVDGRVEAVVGNLEDRSYTFNIVNFDGNGNRSLASEITVAPYGDGWLSTHAERKVLSAQKEGNDAVITMGSPMDEMVGTKFRYRNNAGAWVESEEILDDEESVIILKDVLKGKYFEYQSAYCPKEGIDTVWTGNWIKSNVPVSYNIDGNPSATVTANQVRDNYVPGLILDGIKDSNSSRYFSTNVSSYAKIFPKIIVIDTKKTGDSRMTFDCFKFYQDPDPEGQTRRYIRSVYVYVSDTKFNPDDTNYSKNFGEPAVRANLNQNEAVQVALPENGVTGRYIAIVFRTSFNTAGFIDLWEFEAFGYVAKNAD